MSTYSQYFAIERKAKTMGIPVNRDEVIAGMTQGRTHSLKALSPHEYRELCNYMNQLVAQKQVENTNVEDKMRKKLISLLCNMGYTIDTRPDMLRIQLWVQQYGHVKGKRLNDYTRQELPKLISQAEIMYAKFLDAL